MAPAGAYGRLGAGVNLPAAGQHADGTPTNRSPLSQGPCWQQSLPAATSGRLRWCSAAHGALRRVSLVGVKNPLLIGVQQRLQLWAGRSGGNASQWADTVLSPRSAGAAGATGNDSVQDSQYLTGFDSQFLDDPSLVDAAPPAPGGVARPAGADAHAAARPAAALPSGAEPVLQAPAPAATPAEARRAWPLSAPDGARKPSANPAQFGRYVVQGRLKARPSGPVYEAWDPVQQCLVAVGTVQAQLGSDVQSMLDPQAAADVKARLEQRVLDRARAAVALKHPYILTVLDAGACPQGVYVATERFSGRDMGDALARGWRPRPSLAAMIMRRVAEGLAHAHAKKLVHGDLKPANIQLDDQARPKLLNFGIAQAGRSQGLNRAETSPDGVQYLAPEQLLNGTADARTDIRAVGVMLYELLAMAPAFGGKTAADVTRAVLANRPTPVHELQWNTPRSLAAIATRAMATDPVHRHASAAELVRELAGWSDRHAARKERMGGGGRATTSHFLEGHRWQGSGYLTWASGAALGGVALVWLLMPVARNWMAPLVHAGVAGVVADAAPGKPAAAPLPSSAPDKLAAPSASTLEEREAAYAAKRVGIVSLEVSPEAQVSVNGVLVGTTPPMTQLKLPVGKQSIILRSKGFDPYHITVFVRHEQFVELRHRFTR